MSIVSFLKTSLRRKPAPGASPAGDPRALKAVNVAMVDALMGALPHDEAMAVAIGGDWEFGGKVQTALLKHYGLPAQGFLVDVGCGAGRLANALSQQHQGGYLGIDLVPALVKNARRITPRPDWTFQVIDHIGIPAAENSADMVCFFSVMTHLLHEQSYWYLEEAHRVLKTGGRVVLSFLEFQEPWHFEHVFKPTVAAAKAGSTAPLNVFLDRANIALWADHIGFDVVEFRGGGDEVTPAGNLGQALCVLQKR